MSSFYPFSPSTLESYYVEKLNKILREENVPEYKVYYGNGIFVLYDLTNDIIIDEGDRETIEKEIQELIKEKKEERELENLNKRLSENRREFWVEKSEDKYLIRGPGKFKIDADSLEEVKHIIDILDKQFQKQNRNKLGIPSFYSE